MYFVKDLKTLKTEQVRNVDYAKLFPEQTEAFHRWLAWRVSDVVFYFKNQQYEIWKNGYNPELQEQRIRQLDLGNAPKNDSRIEDYIQSQWIFINTETGKFCAHDNLAALARILNIKYGWLYSRLIKFGFIQLGKYQIARSIMSVKNYALAILEDVI